MIIFEQTFRDLLIQANVVGTRVFLARAPQKPTPALQPPYIVFFMIAPLPLMAHDGPPNLVQRDYQVSIFDLSQSEALAIADTLRGYLDGYQGDFESVHFGSIFYVQQTMTYEMDTRLFHIILEFRVAYRFLGSTAVSTAVSNRSRRSHERGSNATQSSAVLSGHPGLRNPDSSSDVGSGSHTGNVPDRLGRR